MLTLIIHPETIALVIESPEEKEIRYTKNSIKATLVKYRITPYSETDTEIKINKREVNSIFYDMMYDLSYDMNITVI